MPEGVNPPRYSSDVGKTVVVQGSTTRFDEGPESVIQTERGTEWGTHAWKEDKDGNEVPGTRRWYPRGILHEDGSAKLIDWVWKFGGRPDDLGITILGTVEFTPEEWQVHQVLSDDAKLKTMDWRIVVAIYYSLGRWVCKCGNWHSEQAVMTPSLASPSSTNTCDEYKLFWLEGWENTLRTRLWRLRPELREVTLPDGRRVRGLIDPNDKVFRPPPCETILSLASQAFMAAVMAAGGVGVLYTVIEQAIRLPLTVAELKDALRAGAMMREVQEFSATGSGASLPPSQAETSMEARASGLSTRSAATTGAGSSAALLVALSALAALAAMS